MESVLRITLSVGPDPRRPASRVIPAGAEEGKNKGSTVRTPRVAGRSHIRVISGGTARARKGKKGRRRRGLSSLL